jgi:GNAT superfamily N-acetyltransferase
MRIAEPVRQPNRSRLPARKQGSEHEARPAHEECKSGKFSSCVPRVLRVQIGERRLRSSGREVRMEVRDALGEDLLPLARLWHHGWTDAHADILPVALARLRTAESFVERLRPAMESVRTVGEPGAPLGFHWIKGDELYQIYVAAEARGQGVAQALMADAEARFLARGIARPWLACAIGNERAARFYRKAGWTMTGVECVPADTAEGPFPLDVWRFERALGVDTASGGARGMSPA